MRKALRCEGGAFYGGTAAQSAAKNSAALLQLAASTKTKNGFQESPDSEKARILVFDAVRCTMARVANIASLLKQEIARVARKQVRAETLSLKKAVSAYRSEIATLKRRAQALESELRRLGKSKPTALKVEPGEETEQKIRFTAKGLASQRRRLGLSAADCGLLLGTSGQSIYNWEEGKARPSARFLSAIARLRTVGKNEAASRLAALR